MPEQIGKTLLLVEDEAIISMAEIKTLETFGYKAIPAYSGEEAVDLALGDKKPDLILMDIDLGRGIDGPTAAARILDKKKIPIVFLTSHSERDMVEKVRGITRYGYIIKNSGNFVLRSSIEMAFDLFDAHKTLEASENRYRTLYEQAIVGMAELGRDGTICEPNTTLARILGSDIMTISGANIFSMMDEPSVDTLRAYLLGKNTGSIILDSSLESSTGNRIPVEIFCAGSTDGKGETHFCVIEDKTELIKAEEEKEKILGSMSELFAYYDKDLIMRWANTFALERLGIPRDEVIGRTCYDVWEGRTQPCEKCPVFDKSRCYAPEKNKYTDKNGVQYENNAYAIREPDGTFVALVEIMRKISA